MKRSYFIAIGAGVGLVLLLTLIFGLKMYFTIQKYANFSMPPETVTSLLAEEEEWTPVLKAVGSAVAVQGVTVSTDQPGIVAKINFESGQSVKQGDLLVQIDTSQEEAQARSADAQMRLAQANLQRQENLLKSRVSSQSDYDSARAQFDEATARVQEMKASIDKKTIRAPFTGVLGIRMVNLGQYLESGAKVAPLQALDPIYVNFWMPQQSLGKINVGQGVAVTADGLPGKTFSGKINAIDSVVDEATRNVRVQATFTNTEGQLRPGMYVNAEVALADKNKYVILPATAIQYAPYGDTVYIVEDMKDAKGQTYKGVRQQVVTVGESKGDRIAILTGVKAGEEVVTSGVFKLRQGGAVKINNAITPDNNSKPDPDDT
ncbi:MAG: efflux RND transporter periplasmic adaptor subunit [Saprospiraceae bacterium]